MTLKESYLVGIVKILSIVDKAAKLGVIQQADEKPSSNFGIAPFKTSNN